MYLAFMCCNPPLTVVLRVHRKPTWGTCAGLILLAEAANATKKGGQDLIGGLDVRVNRNHFGRQVESFQADLDLPFLNTNGETSTVRFPGVFIRAPVVEKILPNVEGVQKGEQAQAETVVAPSKSAKSDQARRAMSDHVDVMAKLPGRLKNAAAMGAEVNAGEETGDIIAVKQGNVFGTSFHPELTSDIRIHVWWLRQVLDAIGTTNGVQ
jgi:pyridoxal 5'-phosphate synthase pdxT subunit